jgi:DNA polymerase IV
VTLGVTLRMIVLVARSDGSPRRVTRVGAIFDLPPLAECAHDEHGHHGHADRRGERPDQQADSGRQPAVAVALEIDQGVADQSAREAADQNRSEGGDAYTDRRQGRQRSLIVDRLGHAADGIGQTGPVTSTPPATGRPVTSGAPAGRTILHADMDAFFVSVELRRRPELVGQPVVVGGTGARGVVAAASYEARRYGVRSAMPSSVARRRCPHAVFLPGDHELYASVSRDVREIFDRFTPIVEPLSLDEAFLDVTGSATLFGSGRAIAGAIRSAVGAELMLGCSVGVAPNKFLAKLASVEAKPVAHPDRIDPGPGVVVVGPGDVQAFLDRLPVERMWGVGPVTLDKLHRLGVTRVRDLREVDSSLLAAAVGAAQARHLATLSEGRDERAVETDRVAKSIGHEETFAVDKFTDAELQRELVRLADGVAMRLRQAGVGARTITLKVRFAGFQTITRSVTTSDVLDIATDLVAIAAPMLREIDATPGVRLIGLSGSNLGPPVRQLTLQLTPDMDGSGDDSTDSARARAVQGASRTADWESATEAMDAIRDRFGTGAIGPASALEHGRIRVVRPGAQQWGPDQHPDQRPDGDAG